MRTRISTVTQLKELVVEAIMNFTNKVSKISDGSVLNGISFGVAKLAQRAQKDIALIEARKFPSTAFGVYLDDAGYEYGVSARFGANKSSTYVRLVGSPGTAYIAGTHFFKGNHNITFELPANVTIPSVGFTYALVRSTSTGASSNVDPLTINTVNPVPAGHSYVINEFAAIGGSDSESDDAYRLRVRDVPNMISQDTIGRLTQVFIKINPKTFRLFYYGINSSGKTQIAVLTQDGSPLSNSELNDLIVRSSQYLSLSDLQPFGSNQYGIDVLNIVWDYIDMDFRVDLDTSFVADEVRKEIQLALFKYLDFATWKPNKVVEWATLLAIVQSIPGVKYCPDTYFTPAADKFVSPTQLPRIRGFIMRDMNGAMISDGTGSLNPIFFQNSPDNAFITTVLITV